MLHHHHDHVLWQLQISHYVEEGAVGAGRKHVPHIRRSLLPGRHAVNAKRLTGDVSTAPVLTIDDRSIGDSTRIIAAIEERWPQPPLYPEDAAQQRRALELEELVSRAQPREDGRRDRSARARSPRAGFSSATRSPWPT